MAHIDNNEYILQPHIMRPIISSLCTLYKSHTTNPIEALGHILLGLSKKPAVIEEEGKRKEQTKLEEKAMQTLIEARDKAGKEEKTRKEKDTKKHQSFIDLMNSTENYKDIMEELCEYIKEFTNATGVYVGELTNLRKPITDEDITAPPVDEAAPQVIKYVAANEDHAFMKKLYLEAGKGVTFNALKAKEEEVKEEEKEPKEGESPKKVLTEEEKTKKQIVFIKEVLRDEKVAFFVVPRLGSYVAFPLIHRTCLSDAILEQAITDFFTFKQKQEDQEKAKKEWEERIAEETAKANENGTEYKQPEPPKYEEIKLAPYQFTLSNFVLCIDSLGQDREFREEQISKSFELVWLFKTMWDAKEEALLTADKEKRIKERNDMKDFLDKDLQRITEEEKTYVSQKTNDENEADREFMEKFYKCVFMMQQITKGFVAETIKQYPQYHVPKYPQIFQTVFYLLGIKREQICVEGTNTLDWRLAKKFITPSLLQKIAEFKIRGPKENAPPKYMMINKIMPLLADLKEEEVEVNYYAMAQLLKFVKSATEIRIEDIKRRRVKYQQLQETRANQEKQNEEIKKERDDALNKAVEEAKNSAKPAEPKEGEEPQPPTEFKFDEQAFLKEWDTAHPMIAMEELPKPDKDADYEE